MNTTSLDEMKVTMARQYRDVLGALMSAVEERRPEAGALFDELERLAHLWMDRFPEDALPQWDAGDAA